MKNAWRGLGVLCLVWLVMVGAMTTVAQVPPGYEPQVHLYNPEGFRDNSANSSGGSTLVDGGVHAATTKTGGFKSWLADRGMGLVKGIAAGLVGAVVVAALVVGTGAPLLLMAGAAVVSGALYGLFTGSDRFNWTEAIVGSIIGGASVGVGSWITGMGKPLLTRAGWAAVDMVGSGLLNTASYLIHEPSPTWGGALTAFGAGVGLAVAFMGAGAVLKKGWQWTRRGTGKVWKPALPEGSQADVPLGKGLLIPQGLTGEQFKLLGMKIRQASREKGYGENIAVYGSRARGTAGPDSDLDIAIRVSPEEFDRIFKQVFKNVKPGTSKEEMMVHALQKGRIHRGEAGLRSVGSEREKELGIKPVQISVIRIGGPFDQGPYIDLP